MTGVIKKTNKFFVDVTRELKRVSWPRKKELVRYTVVVVATVFFMAVFFAVVDIGMSRLVELILGR